MHQVISSYNRHGGNRYFPGTPFSGHWNRVIKGTKQGYVKILLYDAQSMGLLHFSDQEHSNKKEAHLCNCLQIDFTEPTGFRSALVTAIGSKNHWPPLLLRWSMSVRDASSPGWPYRVYYFLANCSTIAKTQPFNLCITTSRSRKPCMLCRKRKRIPS